MAYDGKLLARARAQLDKIRADNQAEQQRRLITVYARVPRIEGIDERMRLQMTELVRLTLSRSGNMAEQVKNLEKENLDLQVEKAELLTVNGYPVDYLEPIYSCPLCKDSGLYENGPCACLDRLYNMELTKELGTLIKHGNESFESFDLSLYGPEHRGGMQVVYDICRKYAESFPDVSSNLLFQGDTGLGKTFLSACIARVVASKGLSVCYDSAAAALEAFEQQKFSRDMETAEAAAVKVRRMLDCDLMILDDLGTEMISSVSMSALYTLINTRLVRGKKIIISTNCTDAELQKKYTPQICSRIKGEFTCLPFVGEDIRLLKRKK